MRARLAPFSHRQAVTALPASPDRDLLIEMAESAFSQLGGAVIEFEIASNLSMHKALRRKDCDERIPVGGMSVMHCRERLRVSNLQTRLLQTLSRMREESFELARAEFYSVKGYDALANPAPWMAQQPEEAARMAPQADPQPMADPVKVVEPPPKADVAASTEPATATEPATTTEPATATQPAAEDPPLTGKYAKQQLREMLDRGVSRECVERLREEVRENRIQTRSQFFRRAQELLAA